MAWWYNTESGALTSAGSIQSFFSWLQGSVGLGAGWHNLNIPASDTEAQAAAAAVKEYPGGTAPTTSVQQQVANAVSQEAGVPFGSIEAALTAFYDKITDGKMWRSLGWLVLGIIFIVIGMLLLLKDETPVGRVVSAVAPGTG
jgi:hypothetical protein